VEKSQWVEIEVRFLVLPEIISKEDGVVVNSPPSVGFGSIPNENGVLVA
jgi:hypothetical protein